MGQKPGLQQHTLEGVPVAGQRLSMKQGQGAQRKAQCWATWASRVGPSVVASACSGRGQAERGADAGTCWAPAATFVTGPDKWTPLRLGKGQKFRWGRGSGLGKKRRHRLRELHLGREARIGRGNAARKGTETDKGHTGLEAFRMEEGCWSAEDT